MRSDFFFFQAEDGIRDVAVTGVQTCALPISAFPVRIGNRSYYGNCIWDALGIPAMLHKDAQIDASCGCCNLEMLLKVENGRLLGPEGLIHIAVPARDWYKDIVFT